MLAKLALILLVVLFGACMFVAGVMAPDAWQQRIESAVGHLPGVSSSTPPPGIPTPQLTAGKASNPAVGASASAPPSASTTATLNALLVTSTVKHPAPKKGATAYALQLGMYVSERAADDEERRVKTVGIDLPLTRISVLDAGGHRWIVVAVGRFPSTADAQQSSARIASILGMRNLSVIRLPASGKPAS
ncbi:hypothetical protein GCM10027285_15410 [Oleiagrimonas citrea]|uniref:SPOR domain-containing protein n=1 Tax=Oleiagrimonas citrea TaxID=1665687 RepID=A0A846ZRB2_9GAMM|nr:SPOR domain-containing protein [Oleiagrimonas citrea]NKZ40197.1 SPOR domain-containing protein [Oleiagrimonas citrea]